MTAAMFNRNEIVERLLAAGAHLHARDADGRNAARLALIMGADEMAARLAAISSESPVQAPPDKSQPR
jgi:ankyrin repeat protein